MKIHLIKKQSIEDYVLKNARSRASFEIWLSIIKGVDWKEPNEIIMTFNSADNLGKGSDVRTFRLTTGSDNSGIYRIRGSADQINLWPRGSSIFDASGLTALNCYIYNNSIGDSKVRVLDKLEAKLNTLGERPLLRKSKIGHSP